MNARGTRQNDNKEKEKRSSRGTCIEKKLKSSWSQSITKIEKDNQTVIRRKDNQLQIKTKVRKKGNLTEDEYLNQLEPKKKKKKKKKKFSSKLLKHTHAESFVNVEGHLDSESQEESEEQIKILKKKKKKFQCHSSLSLEINQRSDVELSHCQTDGTKENEFVFKRSRKNTALNLKLDGEVTKKKGIFPFSLEGIQGNEHKQSEKVCEKTDKCISPEKAFMGKKHGTYIMQNDEQRRLKRKKKKKKDKSNSFLLVADNQDIIYGVPDSPTAFSDFRKRQKKNSQEITLTNREEVDTTGNVGSIREDKRKKKRSKDFSSLTCEINAEYSHRVPDKHLPAQLEVESEEEELCGKKRRKTIKHNEIIRKERKRKKKIKKMHKEEETTYSEVFLNNDSASKRQKIVVLESNRMNKESEMKRAECVPGVTVDRLLCSSNHVLCDRKKRKKVPQEFGEEPVSKANTKNKKIKRDNMGNEALEHVDDVTIVQEKKGNCDEVNIDKVRRQALQEEIDRESGKTKVFSPKVEQDMKFGQWRTAAFQSSEKEMKFFRLMGGFKKGSAPIQNFSAATNKPNMALTREGEEKLQQALKMEFDKAMDFKQHRGIGLGFQPAANKKVYIDKHATRSIKFED